MISDIISEVGGIINKVVPDSDLRTKLNHEIETQEFKARLAQIEVNKEAAKSGSMFQAGGRAFVLWACGFAVTLPSVAPYIVWVLTAVLTPFGITITMPPLPDVDTGFAYAALTGLLGLGGARTWEKMKGIARNKLS